VIEERLYVVRRHPVFKKPEPGLATQIVKVQIDCGLLAMALRRQAAISFSDRLDAVRTQHRVHPRGLNTLDAPAGSAGRRLIRDILRYSKPTVFITKAAAVR
jgi:hypothetical protein